MYMYIAAAVKHGIWNLETESLKQKRKWNTESMKEGYKRLIRKKYN